MNPYEVLGVSENADDETIKKAYRELVKKYHPDRYVNNPLADLAAEKMKEINRAYDTLTGKGAPRSQYSSQSYSAPNYGSTPSFGTVRSLLNSSRVREAIAMLEMLPRNAEWYYLSGRARIMIGWYDQGISLLRTAVRMDPNNEEYISALNNVESRNKSYTNSHDIDIGCCSNPCALCTALSICCCM